MTDDDKILIDEKEKVAVRCGDFPNEISTLGTLVHGMKQLYAMVKQREYDYEQAGGNKIRGFSFGATSPEESHLNTSIACFFHWFGISLCNYVRLSGYILGIHKGEFSRTDLASGSRGNTIKKSIDKYVSSVTEIGEVLVWRNKVFGHFAITDPRNDNIATLDMSVVFPVALEDRYCVGSFGMRKSDPRGIFQSALPHWSLTKVFESLEPRYWPGLAFTPRDPPPGEQHSHPAIDRLLQSPIMKNLLEDKMTLSESDLFETCSDCKGDGKQRADAGEGAVSMQVDKCNRCNGRGKLLTPTGKVLHDFIQEISEPGKERFNTK